MTTGLVKIRYLLCAIAVVVAGCSSAAQSLPKMPGNSPPASGAGKISHVVFIVQENRSFDNLFQGYPGADTASSGTISIPGTNCRMDGFDKEQAYFWPPSIPYAQYVYVPHNDSRPYFDMAHEGVVADRMFQSHLDESFVAHQYIIAAQAAGSVDLPTSAWGCGGGPSDVVGTLTLKRGPGKPQSPCFDYQTLGDELDNADLSWRFYTSKYGSPSSGSGSYWSSYQAVKHIYMGLVCMMILRTP